MKDNFQLMLFYKFSKTFSAMALKSLFKNHCYQQMALFA